MGESALCCVSQGMQEQGCWEVKALQLIDPVSTRGPGPPLATEIHITRAPLRLTGARENCSIGGPYIFFPSGRALLGEAGQVPNGQAV